MNYQNKVVLITGASSDIAKEMAHFFSKKKAIVILTYYHSKEKVIELQKELVNEYHNIVDVHSLNLCKEDSVISLYNYVNKKYHYVDILINNAALSLDNAIPDKTKEEFMNVLKTNVVGTFLMMKYFDNIMSNGYIFNMSSTDGIDTGNVYSIDYNASKAAINNMTKTFALYSKNIIISLCPNWINTESTRKMDKEYLECELKRVHQKELIKPSVLSKVIDKCIKENMATGSIIRIEGEKDVRRVD